ncbi:MAG: ribose 5-phosphate isomerase B [Planctomycetota bacterium]
MKITVGGDHASPMLKKRVVEELRSLGHDVSDIGAFSEESVDYPDFAAKVARDVSAGKVDRGVLICGTGIGMSIVANKFPGVRAAVVHDLFTAEVSRSHNDANILCLGARVLTEDEGAAIVRKWIDLPPDGGRHKRRVEKILRIEADLQNDSRPCRP